MQPVQIESSRYLNKALHCSILFAYEIGLYQRMQRCRLVAADNLQYDASLWKCSLLCFAEFICELVGSAKNDTDHMTFLTDDKVTRTKF